jgi:hypothetical protein
VTLRPAGRSTTWYTAARIDACVDTSALIAILDVSDTHHALFRRLFAAPPGVVVTSSLVMREDEASSCWSTDRHLGSVGTPLAIHAA